MRLFETFFLNVSALLGSSKSRAKKIGDDCRYGYQKVFEVVFTAWGKGNYMSFINICNSKDYVYCMYDENLLTVIFSYTYINMT